MYRITELENAIIERIKAAQLPYLRFVGSYGGELTGNWDEVVRTLPAVWVTFKGAGAPRPLNTAQTRWRMEVRFATVCASRSLRSEAAARQGLNLAGQRVSIGAYQMVQDVAALVIMQDFGLEGVDYLHPAALRNLFNAGTGARALAVFAQDWITSVDFRLREPCAVPLGAGVEAYLPPAGEVTLPDAAPEPAFLKTLALRYWLKPPQDVALDPPAAEDALTLNIEV